MFVGDALPKGKQRYLEWVQTRREELEQYRLNHGIHFLADDCDSDIEPLRTFPAGNRSIPSTAPSDDNNKYADLVESLRTPETFAKKYFMDSEDESDEDNTQDVSKQPQHAVQQGRASFKKKRKSGLFPKLPCGGKPQPADDDDALLRSLVPPGASGIVGVMGRRIHADRLIQNDTAGLYSMLRAWVKDAPDHESSPSTAAPRVPSKRKTLSEYAALEIAPDNKNNDSAVSESVVTTTTTRNTSPPSTPKTVVDVLGWMDTPAHLRSTTPCYPTQEEMRKLLDQRRARHASRAARKKRLDAVKERLKRKGVRF